jgi:hypothetical protein
MTTYYKQQDTITLVHWDGADPEDLQALCPNSLVEVRTIVRYPGLPAEATITEWWIDNHTYWTPDQAADGWSFQVSNGQIVQNSQVADGDLAAWLIANKWGPDPYTT